MTGVFAPQHHQNTNLFTSAVNNPQYHSHQTGAHPWSASSSPSTMDSGPSHAVGYNVERSFHPSSSSSAAAMAGPSTNTMISKDEDEGMATSLAFARAPAPATPSHYLPRQDFSSSPSAHNYPASTMAAVEATRARFFARQSSSSSSARRGSRPTMTGSTSLPAKAARPVRTHKGSSLSSASSGDYRQSFFDRCQKAMDQTRSRQRGTKMMAFRKGIDGATPGLFSDEIMDEDEDGDETLSSSPPPFGTEDGVGEREEDDELTRRRIIAEYSRLKRIYELKGKMEIGWIDPDQLDWLESEVKQQQQYGQEGDWEEGLDALDPYAGANDEELEELWREAQAASQQHNGREAIPGMMEEDEDDQMMMDDDDFSDGDAAFEEALARLPY